MALDEATRFEVAKINGVAGCADSVDGTGSLQVDLVEDTPVVREAVLKVIANKLPNEKVVFKKTGELKPQ